MSPKKILDEVKAIISERGQSYGNGIEDNFRTISIIARAATGHRIEPHDVAMFMVALKIARIKQDVTKRDSYIDAIAYLAFAAEIAEAE